MGIYSGMLSMFGGALSASKQNKANFRIAQMNNKFNERMLDKQIAYNKEMYATQLGDQWQFYNDAKQNAWDMAEYNSAPAARQRLEAAGLNPFMMLNGGSAGTASFGGSGSAPGAQGITPPTATPYSADYSSLASGISQAAADLSQEVDRDKTRAETEGIRIENQFKAAKAMADLNETLSRTSNDKERVMIEKFMASIAKDRLTSDLAVNNQNIANMRAEEKLTILQSLQASKQLSWMDAQNRMDLAQKAADVKLKFQAGALSKVQAEHEVKKMAETVARTHGQKLSNDRQQWENNTYYKTMDAQAEMFNRQNQFEKDTYNARVEQVQEELFNTIFDFGPAGAGRFGARAIQSVGYGVSRAASGVKSLFD